MTISSERRERLRLAVSLAPSSAPVEQYAKDVTCGGNLTCDELRTLLHDSARLERIEKLLREIAQRPHETGAMKLYFRDDKRTFDA